MRLAIALLIPPLLAAGRRGPVQQEIQPGAFRNLTDVLLIQVVSDDGDTSMATVERVFRGRESPGPIAIQWNIAAPEKASGRDAHAGDRLIVTGGAAADRFFVQSAFEAQDLTGKLPPPPRSGPLQLASFLILLAVPVLQIVCYLLRRRSPLFLKINLLLPLAAIADYAFYESGIPSNVNIRIDLLLLIPIGALIALLWVIFAVRDWNARRDAPHPKPH